MCCARFLVLITVDIYLGFPWSLVINHKATTMNIHVISSAEIWFIILNKCLGFKLLGHRVDIHWACSKFPSFHNGSFSVSTDSEQEPHLFYILASMTAMSNFFVLICPPITAFVKGSLETPVHFWKSLYFCFTFRFICANICD